MSSSDHSVALGFAAICYASGVLALGACPWAGWRAVKRGKGLLMAGFYGFGVGLLLLLVLSAIAQVMLIGEAKQGFSTVPGCGMMFAGSFLTPAAFLLGLLGGAVAGGRSWRSGPQRVES